MILRADARALPLRDGCVQTVVTSPPYWGLRDYGHAQQLGLETSPALYVTALVAVFADVRRVLRDDGTVWLNLADSYATGAGSVGECPGGGKQGESWRLRGLMTPPNRMPIAGLKPKDLCMIPARVALALQADGWYLRSDIIWAKPAPMPESVTDRPTTAHEHVFLLAKSETYWYDADAIREPHAAASLDRYEYGLHVSRANALPGSQRDRLSAGLGSATRMGDFINYAGRNKRTVWTINTQNFSGAHFATFPEALVEPCILAGCPRGGLVLDPFLGSGTVGVVAERLGRRWVGTDLSYHDLATARTRQRGLLLAEVHDA